MKIAISATGQHKESLLDRRFGRCNYFQIFNTETGDYKVISNNGVSSGGGTGIAAASQVIEENDMNIAILSRKGGTGKTTVVAALSEIAKKVIKVDCDVDAPNLYLFYQGTDIEKKNFYGGKKARINRSLCIIRKTI